MTKEVKLGEEVKCRVTGFKGIITSMTEYINGCVQCYVTPKQTPTQKKEGDYPGGISLDIEQLERVSIGLNNKPIKSTPTGGPVSRTMGRRQP